MKRRKYGVSIRRVFDMKLAAILMTISAALTAAAVTMGPGPSAASFDDSLRLEGPVPETPGW